MLDEMRAYYRARADEYDEWFERRGRYDRGDAHRSQWDAETAAVERWLESLALTGDVLELAGGTGWWTERLAATAATLTVVDASPETLVHNRTRVARPDVRYIADDLFDWTPDTTYDAVFFSFWMSHVPDGRFDEFWEMVRSALRPDGRAVFVDSLRTASSGARTGGGRVDGAADRTVRTLNDGQEFTIVKVFYDLDDLDTRLRRLGFVPDIRRTDEFFFYGSAGAARSTAPPGVCLATVLVGDDKPSQIYVRMKHKKAQEAGLVSRGVELPADATQESVEAAVAELVADPTVHGILVQLPLPDHLDPEPVLAMLPPEKDVDGLTERSMGRLVRGLPGHVPCTPLGVMRLLDRYGIEISHKRAVVVGRSTLVGLPQVLLLGRKGVDATVTLAHSRTDDMIGVCREADILVAAAGQAHMITADHVKPGAAVVDVGVSRSESGIVGDVDFDAVQAVAGAITPMPGGTGPMTIACLLQNTLAAARLLGSV